MDERCIQGCSTAMQFLCPEQQRNELPTNRKLSLSIKIEQNTRSAHAADDWSWRNWIVVKRAVDQRRIQRVLNPISLRLFSVEYSMSSIRKSEDSPSVPFKFLVEDTSGLMSKRQYEQGFELVEAFRDFEAGTARPCAPSSALTTSQNSAMSQNSRRHRPLRRHRHQIL